MSKMDQITSFHPEDFDVTVQPGVTRKTLNYFLKDHGLWFPVGKFWIFFIFTFFKVVWTEEFFRQSAKKSLKEAKNETASHTSRNTS